MKLTPSGVILLGALALALTAKSQTLTTRGHGTGTTYTGKGLFVRDTLLNSKINHHLANPESLLVMLEIVLTNQTSMHFFRKGYKRGEQYWYLDGHRIRPLPKNWFVWEWKIIKP